MWNILDLFVGENINPISGLHIFGIFYYSAILKLDIGKKKLNKMM